MHWRMNIAGELESINIYLIRIKKKLEQSTILSFKILMKQHTKSKIWINNIKMNTTLR
jgi:hypothetical protein